MNLSISELNNMINEGIETNFPKKINVIGEISNIKCSRGHYYLNLKDNNCLVRAIIWKSKYDKLNIDLQLMSVGVILFSLSIYLLNLQDLLGVSLSFLGPITPLGGLFLIGSWSILLFSVKKNSSSNI